MSFLAVAGELKVKGLSENLSGPKQESVFDAPPSKPVAPCMPEEQPPCRKPLPTSVLQSKRQSLLIPQNDTTQDFVSVKLEPCEAPPLEQQQAHPTTFQSSNGEDGAGKQEHYEDEYNGEYEGEGYVAQHDREVDGGKTNSLNSYCRACSGFSIYLFSFF